MSKPGEWQDDGLATLSQREGRRPPRGGPYAGVPDHLLAPLRGWLYRALDNDLEEVIALRLEVALRSRPGRGQMRLPDQTNVDLLDVVDLVLRLDELIAEELEELDGDADQINAIEGDVVFAEVPEVVERLDHLLTMGNSVYRVARHARPLRLIQPLDPTVTTATAKAVGDAAESAADHLHDAWVAAYARDPDPDGAYRDAVRAVEVAISTVVSPNNDRQTLGTAIRDLRNGAHNYEIVLLDKTGGGSVEPLLLLLERLWEGQKSRHGAGAGARPSTVEEARAAVQIAVLAVQWLSDGALRRRSTPGTRP